MLVLFKNIRSSFLNELPIIKLYSFLYLLGIFIGGIASVLLRSQFSEQAKRLLTPEIPCAFGSAFWQQLTIFIFLFFLGLTAIGAPLLPLYPIYKGFSLSFIVSLCIVFYGVRGFLIGFPAFFIQNLFYLFLGYFVCYSSARLSVSFFQLILGRGKHSATHRELIRHLYCILLIIPFIFLGALWEWKVVSLILKLF